MFSPLVGCNPGLRALIFRIRILKTTVLLAAWFCAGFPSEAQTAQTLNREAPDGPVLLLGQACPLTASASSGLPVGFRVDAGPAVIKEPVKVAFAARRLG
jgi:hypothetical protein